MDPCKSTSEIKTFDSNVKQNVLNDEKRRGRQRFPLCHVFGFHHDFKAAYSVTMNIFRKKIFSFQIICKSRIKLCCHNKSNFYS